MAASMPESSGTAPALPHEGGWSDAAPLSPAVPVCCDEIYMFGLPWDSWLACDCGGPSAGDPTFMPAIVMATRRLGAGLLLATERLARRIAG